MESTCTILFIILLNLEKKEKKKKKKKEYYIWVLCVRFNIWKYCGGALIYEIDLKFLAYVYFLY